MPVPPASAATATEFNFDSSCSTPYITAPSTPQRLPTTNFSSSSSSAGGGVPFEWEEKPGTPKRSGHRSNSTTEFYDDDEEFEFDFSGQLSRSSLSAADELFYGGKIRPLKPPPGYESSANSPRSPKSPKKKKEFDPFQAAIDETTRNRDDKQELDQRGRERRSAITTSTSSSTNYDPNCNSHAGGRRGISRSMSPMRVSDEMLVDVDGATSSSGTTTGGKQSYAAAFLSAISFSKGGKPYKKWKLRDLLLFRSASEGRATSLRSSEIKYAVLSRRSESSSAAPTTEDARITSSFRSTESFGSSRRMRAAVSAHEMHYTTNRAAAEEMRRKTFLPYKQGLLGCLGFSPGGGVPDISSRGVGSLTRG
ncbi:hypothetical protein LINGRAHAP2_LOCUS4559 [Linum grandiflorum]